ARARLGEFIGADPADLAFVTNATTGVNTVLASLEFEPGDEILVTDHEYNACINAARRVASRHGASVLVAQLPLPTSGPQEMLAALDFIGGLSDGGWPEVMAHNHTLVLSGRQKLLAAVGGQPLAPDPMLGSLAAIDLPDSVEPSPLPNPIDTDPNETYPGDPL